MNILFFDTETTGFTKYKDKDGNDLKNHGRMTQLAYMVVGFNGQIIEEYSTYIKPDGWFVPDEDFFIENGMSTELCESKGVPVYEALRNLQEALKISKIKVAHNISFDNRIIMNEMIRCKITHQLFQFKMGFCTMYSSRKYVGALSKVGTLKMPNLTELHTKLFEVGFEGAHDALSDVAALKDCFFELVDRNLILIK